MVKAAEDSGVDTAYLVLVMRRMKEMISRVIQHETERRELSCVNYVALYELLRPEMDSSVVYLEPPASVDSTNSSIAFGGRSLYAAIDNRQQSNRHRQYRSWRLQPPVKRLSMEHIVSLAVEAASHDLNEAGGSEFPHIF